MSGVLKSLISMICMFASFVWFEEEKIQKYLLYPFDRRWCYYSSNRPLWNEPRPALVKNNFQNNKFIDSKSSKDIKTDDFNPIPRYNVK